MRHLVRELIETIILALLIFLAIQFSVQNFRVEGSSMEPTLEENQFLLVNKLVYLRFDPQGLAGLLPFVDSDREDTLFPFHAPRRGDIIIFHFPLDESRDFVKRVIGVPGDNVVIRAGRVFVNGEPLDEPYVTQPDRRSLAELTVAPKSYFVLGDRRRGSNDSRDWGTVPEDNIVGRGWVSYWPLDSLRTLSALVWH